MYKKSAVYKDFTTETIFLSQVSVGKKMVCKISNISIFKKIQKERKDSKETLPFNKRFIFLRLVINNLHL